MNLLFTYVASVFSIFFLSAVLFFVLLNPKKIFLQYYCCFLMISLLGWIITLLIQDYFNTAGNENVVFVLENIKYLFISITPVFVLMIAVSFAHLGSKVHPAMNLLFIMPLFTQFFLWTNELHHLFYISFSFDYKPVGPFFYVYALFSYVCIIAAIVHFVYFCSHSDKSTRCQAWLISVGTVFPASVNLIYSFDILPISIYATPIAFSVMSVTYLVAIKKFNFLVNMPVLLRTMVDRVSYIFIAVDTDMCILDFNQTAQMSFQTLRLKTGMNFHFIAQSFPNVFEFSKIFSYINEAKEKRESVFYELKYSSPNPEGKSRYYKTEFTPIIQNGLLMGCIIMGQDITKQKQDAIYILEQERLMSISSMMIGLVQNLQTPMVLIEKNSENISALTDEYMVPGGCKNFTPDDFQEIFIEIRQNLQRQKVNIQAVTSILNAISEQSAQHNSKKVESFIIKDLIDRLQYLIKDKLAKSNCTLKTTIRVPENVSISGNISSLVQVLCNLVLNSIQAYKGREGLVYLTISESEGFIQIAVGDFAGGIPEDVQDKIFKQIVTTKGKQYTGIGLYMSYAAIVGSFHGKMWFTTKPHEGTEFFFSIPLSEKK